MNEKKLKINLFVIPISWVVGGITALVLGLCGLDWTAYLIGLFTSLLNFGLMSKNSRKMARLAELDPGVGMAKAKNYAWKGGSLRLLVAALVFAALYFKDITANPGSDGLTVLILALCGYVTVKVVLVLVYIIFRKKVEES